MFASKLDISNAYKVIYSKKGYKPLCFVKNDLLVFKKGKLFKLNLENFTLKYVCSMEMKKQHWFFSRSRLLTRLLRLEPRGVTKVNEDVILLSFKGSIYRLDLKRKNTRQVHSFRSNMSSPLYLTTIYNIKGFNDSHCYGEYFSNPEMNAVSIYRSNKNGFEWHEAYRFAKGEINHVHSILPDSYQNRVWIFTGDFGNAASIWYTDDDFKTVKKYLSGKQHYRACVGFPTPEGLVYATDTPLEDNYIYLVSKEKKLEKLYRLNGSTIFGTNFKNKFILSTVVEGHADGSQGKWGLISYRRGKGIKSWYSDLVIGNLENGFKTIGSFRKDLLPMGLMQFGTITFPAGHNPTNKIVMYGQSSRKIDGRLLIWSKSLE